MGIVWGTDRRERGGERERAGKARGCRRKDKRERGEGVNTQYGLGDPTYIG